MREPFSFPGNPGPDFDQCPDRAYRGKEKYLIGIILDPVPTKVVVTSYLRSRNDFKLFPANI